MSTEAKLQKKRRKLGISQRRLSKMSGVPLYRIQLSEQGLSEYKQSEIDSLENALMKHKREIDLEADFNE